MVAQASRAASPTVDTHPNTDSTSPIIEHYAALLGALLDSVRGNMSSYKVPALQGSPLDGASDWPSLRLSLRSALGTPSSAFVADAASIYTGTAHRPKERAAQVIAAMERIGPAKLAEGCIELEREAFAGAGGKEKSAGRQAWYGAAEAISWLYAVRSAFLWDGSSDIRCVRESLRALSGTELTLNGRAVPLNRRTLSRRKHLLLQLPSAFTLPLRLPSRLRPHNYRLPLLSPSVSRRLPRQDRSRSSRKRRRCGASTMHLLLRLPTDSPILQPCRLRGAAAPCACRSAVASYFLANSSCLDIVSCRTSTPSFKPFSSAVRIASSGCSTRTVRPIVGRSFSVKGGSLRVRHVCTFERLARVDFSSRCARSSACGSSPAHRPCSRRPSRPRRPYRHLLCARESRSSTRLIAQHSRPNLRDSPRPPYRSSLSWFRTSSASIRAWFGVGRGCSRCQAQDPEAARFDGRDWDEEGEGEG